MLVNVENQEYLEKVLLWLTGKIFRGGGGKFDFLGGSDLWDLWEQEEEEREEERGDLFLSVTTIERRDLGHTTTSLLALETSLKRESSSGKNSNNILIYEGLLSGCHLIHPSHALEVSNLSNPSHS